MLQLETPAEVSLAAAQHARSIGVRVVWDPAPAVGMPDGAYESLDVLAPNQGEAASLTGIDVTDVDSAGEAADTLLARGVPTVVVKLGEQGVYYAGRSEQGHVPAFRLKAVDTIAAGDAFGAALAVALSEGRGLGDAVRFGAAAGALAVTKLGAQEAMPSRSEVEAFLDRVG
jgi:ribokinase